jgi:uncharacterized membrane protein
MITFTVPAFILIAFVVFLIGGIAGYSAIFFKK